MPWRLRAPAPDLKIPPIKLHATGEIQPNSPDIRQMFHSDVLRVPGRNVSQRSAGCSEPQRDFAEIALF
jgi:hypothetical protein